MTWLARYWPLVVAPVLVAVFVPLVVVGLQAGGSAAFLVVVVAGTFILIEVVLAGFRAMGHWRNARIRRQIVRHQRERQ